VRTETRKQDGTVTTSDYLVDTSGPLSQVVAETSEGKLTAYYVRGDNLLAVLRPGAEVGAWASRFYHADGLGSIRALTDETGQVTDRYSYTAFGEMLAHQGDDPSAYLFAEEPLDPSSGFYYNRARWMDPRVGRFTSMDPLEGVPNDPATLHKYLYVANRPADAVDPTGQQFSGPGLVVAVAIVVIAIALIYWAYRPQKQATPTPLEQRSPFFKAMDSAAIQGMQGIRQTCIVENWEYCGPVCVRPDGIACEPGPVVRGRDRGDCSNFSHCTAPLETVAVFHCHPKTGDTGWAGDELFSIEDQFNFFGGTIRAVYLITPSGRMKRYTKWQGSVDLNP
jgi:RHS repeat-associated protein